MGAKDKLLIAPRCILCRTCTNYKGRVAKPERRLSPRTCAAGRYPDPRAATCESYVPLRIKPDFKAQPGGTLFRPDRRRPLN